MPDYWSIPGFEGLYLEDSWVLDVVARPGVLELVVELVLRESHPSYQAPADGEQYCYRRGVMRFEGVSCLKWNGRIEAQAVDAAGERDYGSIDALRIADSRYVIEGEFGRVTVVSASPTVEFVG